MKNIMSQNFIEKTEDIGSVVICSVGTLGDIGPMLNLAIELKGRGFSIVFLTNDYFKDLILKNKIQFESIGDIESYKSGMSNQEVWSDGCVRNYTFEMYHLPAFKPAFEFVEALAVVNKCLCVISRGPKNGARMAAEQYNIPSFYITLSPNLLPKFKKYIFHEIKDFFVKDDFKKNDKKNIKLFNKVRSDLGFGPYKYNEEYDGKSHQIAFFPEWFSHESYLKNIAMVGFPIFNIKSDFLENKIDEFIENSGSPLVFSGSTGFDNDNKFFLEALSVCKILKKPGIFIGKGNVDEASKNNVLVIGYANFSELFPKCLAVIHHGGIGTVAQAIRAGIPQLIRPITFDQPDNAQRIQKLGLGMYLSLKDFNSATAANLIGKMMSIQQEKRHFSRYVNLVSTSDAIETAADLICDTIKKID